MTLKSVATTMQFVAPSSSSAHDMQFVAPSSSSAVAWTSRSTLAVFPLSFVILSGASAPLLFRRVFCGGRTRSRRACPELAEGICGSPEVRKMSSFAGHDVNRDANAL